MRKRITLPIFIAPLIVGALAVLAIIIFYSRTQQPQRITIATATEGSTYFLLGDELSGILRRLNDQRFKDANALPTSGSKDNIQLLMDPNSPVNVAFTMKPDLVRAAYKNPHMKQELRILARLYRDVMQNPKTIELSDPNDSAPSDANTSAVAPDVFLVCRKDLPKDLAFVILNALFDNIDELLLAHAKAKDIKLTEAFDVPKGFGFQLHPGAVKFQKKEEEKLLIATGALDGKYYQLGKAIQDFLEKWGIPARAIQTDGSLENAKLLTKDRPTIAIMQYDAALACFGKAKFVYKQDLSDVNIPVVSNIRRITRLHEEKVHVIVRRKKLKLIEDKWAKIRAQPAKTESKATENIQKSEQDRTEKDSNATSSEPDQETHTTQTITSLDQLREALEDIGGKIEVCVGPEGSASQLVTRTILKEHLIMPFIKQRFLSVSEMVNQLDSGDIDMGFFVSYVPSEAMRDILDSDKIRLLSLGDKECRRMGDVFNAATIDPKMYGCQHEDEGSIKTLATQAVLVATENLPSDVVKTITKAIFENIAFLDIKNPTKKDMAAIELDSPLLHPGAEQYYKEVGLLFSEPPLLHRLQKTWYILGCLTMLITVMFIPAYTGLIILRRSRTGNEIGRRILGIPIEASARDSVQRLLKIRDEIQKRVRRRWWKWGELDKHRWRYLRDLIHDRIGEAKENLTRTFVAEIRDVARNPELDKAARKQRYRSIEDRILEYFEKAELDPSQQKMLRELLRETSQRDAKTKVSKGVKK